MEILNQEQEQIVNQFKGILEIVVGVDDMFPPDESGDRCAPEPYNPRPPLAEAIDLGNLALIS